ncbi:fatty acyl-CoA reductase 1-like isoform X2 [Phymastichus coffea]|uniref:fatty acyl-CoA reductase 1-like isoform X2 n=1 Tax=Phymastichus coffea TaxID=108790 RepID=UPI00273A7DCB|nr:fatty acyl-CoA reductase 1-like isoform X2 [Phymastichus coffea]
MTTASQRRSTGPRIFERLRNKNPNFEEKVCTVVGDLQADRLGLSDEDRRALVESVDIIVHNGATTKFDEKVSVSLKINVLGTKHMLDLATECKRIQVFLYVSTAYSHCYRKNIEEEFYDPPGDLKMIYDMIAADESAKHGLTEDVLKMLLGEYPNVYCFSKAIAEGLVKQHGDTAGFATGVYRPTVVTAAMWEPSPGWVGNNNGPALIFLGTALGVLHTSYHFGYPIDLIPVDLSINALIGIIYDLALQWEIVKQPMMYNFGSSTVNPTSLPELFNNFSIEAPYFGSKNVVWHAFMIFCKKKWEFWFWHILVHFIPAIFADLVLLCMGKKPRALQLFYFGTKHLDKIDYFGNGNWRIHVPQTLEIYDRLSKADQTTFYFDIRKIDWADAAVNWSRGGRIHIVKEPFDNVEETKRFYQRMKKLHYATMSFIAVLITYFAIKFLLYLFSFFIEV